MFGFKRKLKSNAEHGKQQLARKTEETAPDTAWIEAVLQIMKQQLANALEEELKAYREETKRFFQSEESHNPMACKRFESDSIIRRDARTMAVGRECIHSLGAAAEQAYQQAADSYGSKEDTSASGMYKRLVEGFGREFGFREEKTKDDDRFRLGTLEDQWRKIIDDTIKQNWKPIHILSGIWDEYNDVICFDEEFNVFFGLYPDDNYYHWGGYVFGVIPEYRVEKDLLKAAEEYGYVSDRNPTAAYFEDQYSDFVYSRIIIPEKTDHPAIHLKLPGEEK